MNTCNEAVMAGFTEEIVAVAEIELPERRAPVEVCLLVKPGTDYANSFPAFDTDRMESVRVSPHGFRLMS